VILASGAAHSEFDHFVFLFFFGKEGAYGIISRLRMQQKTT